MVAVLSRTPVVASQLAQCSASVASGVAATWASSAASSSGRIAATPARAGRGRASEPVCCAWLPPALDRTDLTPNRRAASTCEQPGVDGSQQPLAEVGGILLHVGSVV